MACNLAGAKSLCLLLTIFHSLPSQQRHKPQTPATAYPRSEPECPHG